MNIYNLTACMKQKPIREKIVIILSNTKSGTIKSCIYKLHLVQKIKEYVNTVMTH